MPAITVNRPDLFPAGTTVNAYVDPGRGSGPVSGAPSGSSVTSGVVASNGGLTLSLAASTPYILYASSPDRYLRVMVPRVTAIAVDGVAQGVTSGTVYVPTGKSFAITYSVAPTLRAVKF